METRDRENFLYCDYDQIEKIIYSYEDNLKAAGIDAVCALMRGGMIPGFIAAQILDTRKIFFAEYNRPTRKVTVINPPPVPARILLAEDISGAGNTTPDVKVHLESMGYEVVLLTILVDNKSQITPEFGFYIGDRNCVFPWEKHRFTPGFIKKLEEGPRRNETGDNAYLNGAVDLDGVLLPDLHADEYRNDLAAALSRRHALKPFERDLFPRVPNEVFSIITARPESDRAVTEEWLVLHGITYQKLIMRDAEKYPLDIAASDQQIMESFSRYKADRLLEEGVTHFYESDLWQAVMISDALPMLRVFVWNNDIELRYEISGRKA